VFINALLKTVIIETDHLNLQKQRETILSRSWFSGNQ